VMITTRFIDKLKNRKKRIMTRLMNNHVIFNFDNSHDLHSQAKFLRYIDTLQAKSELTYEPILGIGCWQGGLEGIVCMDYNDYYEFVDSLGFTEGQECVLVLNPVNPRQIHRKQGTLLFSDGTQKSIGEWTKLSAEQAQSFGSYTFFPRDKTYWVCK
jgi:hypothetical protein